ncbi:MAG: hypothetical protein JWO76_3524 [Nocardioides sp.]|nr:hypothetical protein [Nocardioides sp.]
MLTDEERQKFAAIADVLIPSAEGMPSASEAAVPEKWLDEALRHRPDLTAGLRAALTAAGDLPPAEAVDVLNSEHIPAFEALGTLAAGAYFLNPEVKQLIGYPGQVPTVPRDDTDTYFDLLENVLERGQVYRDVPTAGPDA